MAVYTGKSKAAVTTDQVISWKHPHSRRPSFRRCLGLSSTCSTFCTLTLRTSPHIALYDLWKPLAELMFAPNLRPMAGW